LACYLGLPDPEALFQALEAGDALYAGDAAAC